MKVLVLGGTGAIGVHLVQLLSSHGVEIFVTSRTGNRSEGKIHYILGNAQDNGFLQRILRKCKWDAIIDCLVYSTPVFKERVDILLGATAQYVFLSSSRVYADSNQPITETSPRLLDVSQDKEFLSTDEYSLAKARQEDILRNSRCENWTIIRPYITYSEKRLQLGVFEKEEWLYRALHGRTIVFSSDISGRTTTLTHGFDVAKGIMAVIGNPKALRETFHLTTEVSVRWKNVFDIYLAVLEKHLGSKVKVLLDDLEDFQKCKPARQQIVYDRLYNRRFNNSKIAQYVDMSDFMKPEQGLAMCLEGFLKSPRFSPIDWKQEALKDRRAGERTPLREINGSRQKFK